MKVETISALCSIDTGLLLHKNRNDIEKRVKQTLSIDLTKQLMDIIEVTTEEDYDKERVGFIATIRIITEPL